MLNALFSDVFSSGTKPVLELGPFLACTAVSLALGLLIAWTYARRPGGNRSFVTTLVLLPAMVQVVIMLVNGNIGTGVAVAGTFTLVRFRSAPGGAREIGSIFMAMAVGLATGMGYLGAAVLFTLVLCLAALLLDLSNFGSAGREQRILKITVPEGLNFEDAFTDIFDKLTRRCELTAVKTSNLGSLYKLTYTVTLKPDTREKDFLDQLRCRNGNLEISCCRLTEQEDTL